MMTEGEGTHAIEEEAAPRPSERLSREARTPQSKPRRLNNPGPRGR